MKTQKRRANPLRRAILRTIKAELVARRDYGCAIVHTIGVDEDGHTYISFLCLTHDSTWRLYIEVNIRATPDNRPMAPSGCPKDCSCDTQELPEGPEAKAEGPEEVRDLEYDIETGEIQ